MRPHVFLILSYFYLTLFLTTFLNAIQDSDDNWQDLTTVSSQQSTPILKRGKCPEIRGSLNNGWVRIRNRGRIAKFICNKGFVLIGNKINTCIQGKWLSRLPICAAKSQTTINWKSVSKTSTMTPMSVINIKEISNGNTSSFADQSKIPVTEVIDNSSASTTTTTNVMHEVLQLTTTTTIPPITVVTTSLSNTTLQNLLQSTEPTIKAEFITHSTIDSNMTSTESTNNDLLTKTSHFLNASKSTTSLPSIQSLPVSSALASALSPELQLSSTERSSNDQKSVIRPTTISAMNITVSNRNDSRDRNRDSISDMETVRPSRWPTPLTSPSPAATATFIERIIESKTTRETRIGTTAAKPITSTESSIWTNDTKAMNFGNQTIETLDTIAMRVTASSTAVSKKAIAMTITSVLSNQNDRNNFDTNSNRQTTTTTTTTQRKVLIPVTTTPSLSHTMNGTVFVQKTTIMPIIKATTASRRRRQFTTTTPHPFPSVTSDLVNNKLNTSLSILVPIILIAIITTTFTLYIISKRKNTQQNRLSEDSEMRYLTSN